MQHDITFNSDGSARPASVVAVLRHFKYDHLSKPLQDVARQCTDLAYFMANTLSESPELINGLRDLLTAQDNFLRADFYGK